MSWTNDPELEQLFRDEITSRGSALVDGAAKYAAGESDATLTSDMYREGHSIKGTSRVMGFEAMAIAGAFLESAWRSIDSSELEWDASIAEALGALAATISDAIDADRTEGTPEMSRAIAVLETALGADSSSGEASASTAPTRQPRDPVPFDAEPEAEPQQPRVQMPPPPPVEAAAPEQPAEPPEMAAQIEPTVAPEAARVESVPVEVVQTAVAVDVEDAPVETAEATENPTGHESPPELSGSYTPSLADDGPSTLDMLRARSAQQNEKEGDVAEGASRGLADGVDDGDDVGEVIVANQGFQTEDDKLEIEPLTHRRRREDGVDVDLANLQVLSAVDGFDVGGLLGVVQEWATGQTVTVNAGRLYRMINGIAALRVEAEALLHKAHSHRLATGYDGGDVTGLIAALTAELSLVEDQSVELTAVPVSGVLSTVPQLVGFVSRKLGKEVTFETFGGDVLVDRAVTDAIGDPIRQLVVNAVRHGIERPGRRNSARKPSTGRVTVDVKQLEGQIQVTVSDDGAGVNWDEVGRQAFERGLVASATTDPKQLLPVIFSEGFSTVDETELGGSGDGLAVVARTVESLFGRLSLRSEPGRGTIARFTVPTSQALQRIVIIEDGGLRWALPDAAVDQIIPLAQADVDWDAPQPELEVRGSMVPLYAISQVVGGGTASLSEVLVVSHRTGTAAFAVGSVEMVREVATKELGPLLQGPKHITGAALLGAGDVVLVLDPFELVERAKRGDSSGSLNGPRLLIVDDSAGVRAVVAAALSSSGFVTSAVDTVADALEHLSKHHVDAFVVDYRMPGEDGISLVRKIRASDETTPIVILSGVADIDDQKAALAAGANAVLDKSDLREGALAATLHHLLTLVEGPAVEAPVDDEQTTSL